MTDDKELTQHEISMLEFIDKVKLMLEKDREYVKEPVTKNRFYANDTYKDVLRHHEETLKKAEKTAETFDPDLKEAQSSWARVARQYIEIGRVLKERDELIARLVEAGNYLAKYADNVAEWYEIANEWESIVAEKKEDAE